MTRERWAQLGITVQFLIVLRTLGEIFRLKHIHGASFSVAAVMPYVSGALIARLLLLGRRYRVLLPTLHCFRLDRAGDRTRSIGVQNWRDR